MKKRLRSIFSTSDVTHYDLKPRSPQSSPSRARSRDTTDVKSSSDLHLGVTHLQVNFPDQQHHLMSRHDAIKLLHRSESDYGSMSPEFEFCGGTEIDSVFDDDDSGLKLISECTPLKSPTSPSVSSFLFSRRRKSPTPDACSLNVRVSKTKRYN